MWITSDYTSHTFSAEDTSEECRCPTSCHIVSFATQSSLASLSNQGVAEMLLKKSKISKIQKQYEKLLNAEHRMLPQPFLVGVQQSVIC